MIAPWYERRVASAGALEDYLRVAYPERYEGFEL